MNVNFVWDKDNKSIRGSFVNLVITFTILGLVCWGAYDKQVTANLKEMAGLIIGFFTVSFGVWKVSNVITDLNKAKE